MEQQLRAVPKCTARTPVVVAFSRAVCIGAKREISRNTAPIEGGIGAPATRPAVVAAIGRQTAVRVRPPRRTELTTPSVTPAVARRF